MCKRASFIFFFFLSKIIFFFSEASKGCTLFTISHAGVSPLRIAYAIGRKAFLMRWRHHEEWISLNADTANGFELEAEVGLPETPTLLTLLSCIGSPPWYAMVIFIVFKSSFRKVCCPCFLTRCSNPSSLASTLHQIEYS